MSVALTIDVTGARPERVPADLLVAPFFSGERPLRGAAGRLDWRLCGLLGERIDEGCLEGALGETVLIAGTGSVRSGRILLLGLGARAGFGPEDLARIAQDAAGRAVDLGLARAGFALPGEAVSGLAAERRTGAVVRGAAAALADREASLALSLIVAPGEVGHTARALAALAARPGATAVPLRAASGGKSPHSSPAEPHAGGPLPAGPGRPIRPLSSS